VNTLYAIAPQRRVDCPVLVNAIHTRKMSCGNANFKMTFPALLKTGMPAMGL
jgi:hypothetical protein